MLIENRGTIEQVAEISGQSMTTLIEQGLFFNRYKKYFRFTEAEMDARRDGIHLDHLPAPLRPFTQHVFSDAAQGLMRKLGVPRKLGEDNRKLVAGSPLLLAVLLDKEEYRPGELSGFYSVFGMGAAMVMSAREVQAAINAARSDLGAAMQFTNIARDVGEDAAAGRLYLPLRWLREAGLDDADVVDVIGAAAFFNWANRLMLTLGAPDVPKRYR